MFNQPEMQSLLGSAGGIKQSPTPLGGGELFPSNQESLGGAQKSFEPFMQALKLADLQKKRKEEMNSWGEMFSSLLGGENSYSQAPQMQAPGLMQPPAQQRRPRQQLPNAGAQMIESLLGMSMGG